MKQRPERDRFYLEHILQCIKHVEEDVQGDVSRFSNRTIQDSVLRNLQIMSETTTRLTDAVKAKAPEIPWEQIQGFRHRLVHDYFEIDLGVVRRVITQYLPALKASVERLLKETGSAS
jgi:uncharacterized protein with HEPN domain